MAGERHFSRDHDQRTARRRTRIERATIGFGLANDVNPTAMLLRRAASGCTAGASGCLGAAGDTEGHSGEQLSGGAGVVVALAGRWCRLPRSSNSTGSSIGCRAQL